MATATKTETTSITQRLEAALAEPSLEQEETSQETEETKELPKDGEETEESKETSEEEETTEEPEAIKWTDEQQAEIDRLVQGESDKKINTYRQRHESNSELIKAIQKDNADLKRQLSARTGEKRLKRLLEDYDEEGGHSEEDKKAYEEDIKITNQLIDKYNEDSEKIEATVKYIDEMAKGIDPAIARQFYLNDPNPNIRAGGGLDLINEALANIKEYKNFLLVVEQFFPKGGEVRSQLEEVIKGMTDFEGNEKAKKLYLSSQEKGFRIRPRKAPPSPSQGGGGGPELHGEAAIIAGLAEEHKKLGH